MIGNRIKERRQQLGLTQQQIADGIGVKKNTISNYECDISSPSEEIILKLMEFLKCDANYLYGDYFSEDEKPLDENEKKIITAYRSFNEDGKEQLLDYVDTLECSGKYKKPDEIRVVQEEDA